MQSKAHPASFIDTLGAVPPASLEVFRAAALAAGFDEALEREWPANAVLATHTHAFDAEAVVVRGEMWLECGGHTRRLRRGDRFSLARDVPHAERYGPEGAVYWVARRNPR